MAALAAGRLRAEAEYAEELRKIAFAKAVSAQPPAISVAKAENLARGSAEFLAYVDALHAANLAANEAAAQLDYLGKRWEKWRTQMATARTKPREDR